MVKVAVLGGDGLIGSACLRIQTVAASDVAEAVVLAARGRVPART